jgi:hypothetical protein
VIKSAERTSPKRAEELVPRLALISMRVPEQYLRNTTQGKNLMSIDLSKKRIILIHGLAAKPPEEVWLDLCRSCLIENIRVNDPNLAQAVEANPEVIQSAYWADAVPHHIPDDEEYCGKLRDAVDAVIAERKRIKDKFHVGTGERVGAFFKNRGLDVINIFANALTIKDNVMKSVLVETRFYAQEQYVADYMRSPLEAKLREAWDSGCEVALLSHSMGTFISYDALWRFSHRNAEQYRRFRDRSVALYVTLGSPLCDSAVRDLLFAHYHKDYGARQYPTNVGMWHNYACLGDVVCHGADFKDCYFDGMREQRVMRSSPAHLLIEYTNLHNPFRDVEHEGNKGKEKRNPHKEYGYLVQPRLGTWLGDFLSGRLRFK